VNFGTAQRVFLVSVSVFSSTSFRKVRLDPFLAGQWQALSVRVFPTFPVAFVGAFLFAMDVMKSKPTVPVRGSIPFSIASPTKAGVTKIINLESVEAS